MMMMIPRSKRPASRGMRIEQKVTEESKENEPEATSGNSPSVQQM